MSGPPSVASIYETCHYAEPSRTTAKPAWLICSAMNCASSHLSPGTTLRFLLGNRKNYVGDSWGTTAPIRRAWLQQATLANPSFTPEFAASPHGAHVEVKRACQRWPHVMQKNVNASLSAGAPTRRAFDLCVWHPMSSWNRKGCGTIFPSGPHAQGLTETGQKKKIVMENKAKKSWLLIGGIRLHRVGYRRAATPRD